MQGTNDLRLIFMSVCCHASIRAEVKRSKERCLDEAVQLLRKIPVDQLESLDEKHLHLLIKLLLAMQLQTANISTASRKLDQVRQLFLTSVWVRRVNASS